MMDGFYVVASFPTVATAANLMAFVLYEIRVSQSLTKNSWGPTFSLSPGTTPVADKEDGTAAPDGM